MSPTQSEVRRNSACKTLQLRHAQPAAKSRQWYLAYLRRNYGAPSTSASWTTKELLGRGACSTTTTTTVTTTPWPWNEGLQNMSSGVSMPTIPISELITPLLDPRAMELSSPEITCSNALTMTAADQNYFRYFPSSSVVFYYMKNWEWSSLRLLYKGPAAANKIIMRMMLAIAASDMHRQRNFSSAAEKEATKRRAQYHYELAVQEFRQYLEEYGNAANNNNDDDDDEPGTVEKALESESEMIFSVMFLMITYEWNFGHSVKHFQMHIEGVRCMLKAHPEIFVTRNIADTILTTGLRPKNVMSFIPSQLLLWILYMEISGHPRGLTGSLYNTLVESGHSALHPDYLHQCARIWGRCLWAEEYPETQILDDMENHRALELNHHSIIIGNKIWQLALGNSDDPSMTPDKLYAEIMRIRELYSDMFITARFTSSSLFAYRALFTIYLSVCAFEAQILYHRRIFYAKSRPPNDVERQAVTTLLDLLYKQYSVEPKLLHRMPWSIFMVMIETEDPIHRDWAEQRLREVRHLHEGNAYINTLVDLVVERQRMYPDEMVDLLDILQRQYSS
ncbi:hypothetical protein EYB25_006030 [Talaromyces marneffei]|nr:hypothetical protein EYB25_006030 [Talaromyces marneffei]